MAEPRAVTLLLQDLREGRSDAAEEIFPLVYAELRQAARRAMQRERPGHTLQPTALVHEAYLKLVGGAGVQSRDRAHFVAIAARAMRQILIDHARGHVAEKRGGGRRVTLEEALAGAGEPSHELLDIDRALDRLARLDERQVRVVELRFFGGLEIEEIAAALEVSPATVKRDWTAARAWLQRELAAAPEGGGAVEA